MLVIGPEMEPGRIPGRRFGDDDPELPGEGLDAAARRGQTVQGVDRRRGAATAHDPAAGRQGESP